MMMIMTLRMRMMIMIMRMLMVMMMTAIIMMKVLDRKVLILTEECYIFHAVFYNAITLVSFRVLLHIAF